MFWQSLINGFGIFGYYQVWVMLLTIFIINSVVLIISGLISGGGGGGARQASGCLSFLLLGSVSNIFLMSLAVAYILPVMLGSDQFTGFLWIKEHTWVLIKAGGIAYIGTIILGIIPVVGRIFDVPGVDKFFQGMIILRISLGPTLDIDKVIYPSIWELIGYAAVCGVISYLIMLLMALLSDKLRIEIDSTPMVMISASLGYIVGLAVLSMYCNNLFSTNYY